VPAFFSRAGKKAWKLTMRLFAYGTDGAASANGQRGTVPNMFSSSPVTLKPHYAVVCRNMYQYGSGADHRYCAPVASILA